MIGYKYQMLIKHLLAVLLGADHKETHHRLLQEDD